MKTKTFAFALALVLLLTSCSSAKPEPTATAVDIGAVQTAAVETVVAAVTQTAAAFTATPQPTEPPVATEPPAVVPTEAPTATPTPAGTATQTVCDNLVFISDASVPDNTEMTPGQEFVKSWHVKNTGSCNWNTGYNIVFAYGEKMGGQTTAITVEVLSNTEADISIPLKAPVKPGTYSGYWRLASNNGYPFGTTLTVVIVVK